MARPKKKGLEYFTNDVNMYQDIKIRKLIRRKGIQSVSVYHILLCQIYTNGYYLPWDEDLPFIISEISCLEEDTIEEAINYCLEVGLFDRDMFDTHKILTSRSIQERYISTCGAARRKLDNALPYLITGNPVQVPKGQTSDENIISSGKTNVSSEETTVIAEQMSAKTPIKDIFSAVNPENSGKSTQSKVKERKVKHSSSALQRAHAGGTADVAVDNDQRVCASIDDEVTQMLGSPLWKEQVFMRFKFLAFSDPALTEWLNRWCSEAKISGKKHLNLGDAKHHFCSWMVIQEEKINKSNSGHGTDTNSGYRTSEDIYGGAARIIAKLRAEGQQPKKPLPVV